MKKLNKKLDGLASAFANQQLDQLVEDLSPQAVGNYLHLISLRIEQIIEYYGKLTERARQEVKTKVFLATILTTIDEAKNEQLAKWEKIQEKLLKKKNSNGKKREKRIKKQTN